MAKAPKFRRTHGPAYDENDNPTDITVRDDDATARLQGRGLDVRSVMRNPNGNLTVEWRRPPTEQDRAIADEVVPGAAHAHA